MEMTIISTDQAILKKIGNHLRRFRQDRELTQEALAERAGFSRSYYSDVETGKRNISILNLHKLAEALGVPLEEVIAPNDRIG